jgi:hypothetical protein
MILPDDATPTPDWIFGKDTLTKHACFVASLQPED